MRFFGLLLIFLAKEFVTAQSVPDSLIHDGLFLETLEWIDRQENPESAGLIQYKVRALISLGRFDEASEWIEDVLKKTTTSSFLYPGLLNLRGFLFMNTGRNDRAREDLTTALSLYTKGTIEDSLSMAKCHANLGNLYFNTGKYRQAEDQFIHSMNIRLKLFGVSHPEVAAAFNDLGLVYSQTNPELALDYYSKALEWYTINYGKEHAKTAIAFTNLGILYKKLGNIPFALINFEDALRIWKRIFPGGHPNQALVLSYLAQTYTAFDEVASARTLYREAIRQYRAAYGKKHPDLAATSNQLATLYIKISLYDSALLILQEALEFNSDQFTNKGIGSNPVAQDHFNAYVMLYTHQLKASALENRYYSKTLKLKDLRLAVYSLAICDTLVHSIRRQSSEETDKIRLGSLVHEVYEDGVRLCYAIAGVSPDPRPWEERAFRYVEKSKSAVLLEAIAEASARSFAGLPDSLLQVERKLKGDLEVNTRRLAELAGGREEQIVRSALVRLKQDQSEFTAYLQKNYPRYFNLKYQELVPKVSELQQRISADHAFVSYFVAEKNAAIYIFTLTKSSLKVQVRNIPGDLNRLVNGFYNSIKLNNPSTYQQVAPVLARLLEPDLPKQIRKVVIFPSGVLSKIPFEALPAHRKEVNNEFAATYWVNRWSIAYEFSTAMISGEAPAYQDDKKEILLCAPIDFSPSRMLASLPGTAVEVDSIANLFPGMYTRLTGPEASEEKFAQLDLLRFRYIHLATHGLADESAPELSKIYFQESGRTDGDLFAGELYNLSLDADLVTLSACQTGLGKVHRGEGMMGLSRALRYAGAQKVVVSYWSVSDQATAKLMVDFYRDIKASLASGWADYAVSLAQAKRRMITMHPFKNPFYWAAFVELGY